MSRFFSKKLKELVPYTPGEQPTEMKYIKLNTNESPFPPSAKAVECAREALNRLQLYPDPQCYALRESMAKIFDVEINQITVGNGSDEILNFAFQAFCDDEHPANFADITYGFYPVFARLNGVPYNEIPLREDFSIRPEDYTGIHSTIIIANPNAPTGMALSQAEIEKLVAADPNRIVVVDEAYVDFGGETCIPLIKKYDNLLIVGTFSKSRSMAGARLGFAIGCKEIICDLETVRFSTNPYNINSITMAAGIGVMADEEYTKKNCAEIMRVREEASKNLRKLGFELTNSSTNFIFAKHSKISGAELYEKLKSRGILVRHFNNPRITEYNRITVGADSQMQALIATVAEILEEYK